VDAGAVTKSTAIDSTYVKAQRAAFGAKVSALARQHPVCRSESPCPLEDGKRVRPSCL
jgi:hypothetical protein